MSPRSPRKSQLGYPETDSGSGKSSSGKKRAQEDFSLSLTDDQVDIGLEPPSAHRADSKKSPSRPKPGSDSDVRLVSDEEMSVNIASDSEVKLVSPDSDVKMTSSASRRQGPLRGSAAALAARRRQPSHRPIAAAAHRGRPLDAGRARPGRAR